MLPLSTNDLERLVKVMRDMHDYATSSNWEGLSLLDEERRRILEYTPDSLTNVEPDSVRNNEYSEQLTNIHVDKNTDKQTNSRRDILIAEICNLDSRILELVQTKRQGLLDENRGLSAQMKAKALYAKANSIT